MMRVFNRNGLASGIALIMLLMYGLLPGSANAKNLNKKVETPEYNYKVHFRDKNTTDTDWYTDPDDAEILAAWFNRSGTGTTGNPTGLHDGYVDLGFPAPNFYTDKDIRMEPRDPLSMSANVLRIQVPPQFLLLYGPDDPVIGGLLGHELFHNIQRAYITVTSNRERYFPFAIEGTATAMMDAIYDSTDGVAHYSWSFPYYAGYYLNDCYDDYLWSHSGLDGYHSGLFWKYLMEQFGADRTEPHTGHDVIERFWELADANRDGTLTILQDILDEKDRYSTAATDTGVSLSEVIQDFTIANFVRRYANAFVTGFSLNMEDPDRFQYYDENIAPAVRLTGAYNTNPSNTESDPPQDVSTDYLTPGDNTGILTGAVTWRATDYQKCMLVGTPSNHAVGFWAQSSSSDSCWYSLIGVRKSGSVELLKKGTTSPSLGNGFQCAMAQTTNDPFVRLVAIVNGGAIANMYSMDNTYQYSFSYFTPQIDLRYPNDSNQVYVGSFEAPERFTVRVQVNSPDWAGGGYVQGLSADQFSVYVGLAMLTPNKARVLSGAEVMGEYWLTCEAPVKAVSNSLPYSVTVKLGEANDTEEDAVFYDYLYLKQMLALDRSGSMTTLSGGMSRIDAARAAAQLYVDATGSDDRLGGVRFNGDGGSEITNVIDDADVFIPMVGMSNQIVRDVVNLILDEENPGTNHLVAVGSTSMGDGLNLAMDELLRAHVNWKSWIILLSDGHENEYKAYADIQPSLRKFGIHVSTIALGSGCDDGLLQQIATDNNGTFYKVEADDDARKRKSFGRSADMIQALGRTFLDINDDLQGLERIAEQDGSLDAGSTNTIPLTIVEGGLTSAVATIFISETNRLALTIYDPDGNPVPAPSSGDPSYDSERQVVYHIDSIGTGTWNFVISNPGATANDYTFALSAKNRQGAQSQLYFAQFHNDGTYYSQNGLYLEGLPQPIVLSLTDSMGPIRNANITATITHPLKSDIILRLRDNGDSYDGSSDNGVYAAVYAATTEGVPSGENPAEDSPVEYHGTYAVDVTIEGTDNFGRAFERFERGYFTVFENEPGILTDADLDGMPDRYEDLHDCLDAAMADAGQDADGDGLSNMDEYQGGTAPCGMDTDGGGETDGSELSRGANPLNYADDALLHPAIAFVYDQPTDATEDFVPILPEQNIILFSPERGYHSVNLYRSLSPSNGFSLLTNVLVSTSEGKYTDTNLTNNQTYYYYVEALDANGSLSAPSGVFSGTPKSQVPSFGGVMIVNNGCSYTDTLSVPVDFIFPTTATDMRVAFTNDLSSLPWEPITKAKSVALGFSTATGAQYISCEWRDTTGEIYVDSGSVSYIAPSNCAVLIAQVDAVLDTTDRGASVTLTGSDYLHFTTPTNGLIRIVTEPGTYDWRVSLRGYQTQTGTLVAVAGGTHDLGTLTMVPVDADADGLLDVTELMIYDTRDDLFDTDGDGIGDGDEVNYTLTSPTNAASALQLSGGINASSSGTGIQWDSVPGVDYEVYAKDDLESVVDWTFLDTVAAATGTNVTPYLDTTATNIIIRTYRIVVSVP